MPTIIGIIASSIQKAFSTFADTFNRTTSGSLGTSSSGGLWKALKGTWFANGNAAQSDDTASTYPISYIDMTQSSTTSSITTGSWVTVSTGGTVGSISSNSIGGATFYTATITGMSSTTGMAVGQRIAATNGTGSLFGGSPDFVEITNIVSSTSIIYRTKNGTTPTAGTVSNIQTANNDGGSGIALWITDSGNWWGVSYGRSIDTSCNCSTCTQCNTYAYSTACNVYTNYAAYACQSWYSVPFTSYWAYTVYYSANVTTYNSFTNYFESIGYGYFCIAGYASGYSVSYSIDCGAFFQYWQYGDGGGARWGCAYTVTNSFQSGPNYYCIAGFATNTNASYFASTFTSSSTSTNYFASSYYTSGSGTAWYCASALYYSPTCTGWTYATGCNTFGYVLCNCQTCYPPYIRVIQSASNVVSEITRWTLSTMAAAFKVLANGATKVITIRPYKDTAMTTQIGTDLTYTASSATITSKFGIVLSPSDNIQGKTLDDYNITTN
jgi:hypothetical protein